jgi:hypothetical protein
MTTITGTFYVDNISSLSQSCHFLPSIHIHIAPSHIYSMFNPSLFIWLWPLCCSLSFFPSIHSTNPLPSLVSFFTFVFVPSAGGLLTLPHSATLIIPQNSSLYGSTDTVGNLTGGCPSLLTHSVYPQPAYVPIMEEDNVRQY